MSAENIQTLVFVKNNSRLKTLKHYFLSITPSNTFPLLHFWAPHWQGRLQAQTAQERHCLGTCKSCWTSIARLFPAKKKFIPFKGLALKIFPQLFSWWYVPIVAKVVPNPKSLILTLLISWFFSFICGIDSSCINIYFHKICKRIRIRKIKSLIEFGYEYLS